MPGQRRGVDRGCKCESSRHVDVADRGFGKSGAQGAPVRIRATRTQPGCIERGPGPPAGSRLRRSGMLPKVNFVCLDKTNGPERRGPGTRSHDRANKPGLPTLGPLTPPPCGPYAHPYGFSTSSRPCSGTAHLPRAARSDGTVRRPPSVGSTRARACWKRFSRRRFRDPHPHAMTPSATVTRVLSRMPLVPASRQAGSRVCGHGGHA